MIIAFTNDSHITRLQIMGVELSKNIGINGIRVNKQMINKSKYGYRQMEQ